MQFDELIGSMNQDIYERLVQAVETGKWPDGNKLTDDQRDNSIQLVMAYQARHANSEEAFTINANGEIITRTKRELKAQFNDDAEKSIARFKLDQQKGE